ncbi:CsiV family protein [Alishewanella sp. HL-SH06]|uniref:CsiV family protein n=1 Tax=Alishewanella sp. HL-SH06 TaxID=3461144 RepID=UPI0040415CCB
MKVRLLLTGCLLLNTMLLQANERWFEVELIVFERTGDSQLREHFPEQVTPIRLGRIIDLVSPLYNPSIQPLVSALEDCSPAPLHTAPSGVFPTNWQAPQKLFCQQETQPLAWQRLALFPEKWLSHKVPWPSRLPHTLAGRGEFQGVPFLAEPEAFALTDVVAKLRRQRQQQVLLHTVWRQAPVTERRAIPSRWFAGENFSQRFDYWGQPITSEQDDTPVNDTQAAANASDVTSVLEQINSRRQQLAAGVSLDQPSTAAIDNSSNVQSQANLPTEVWQLDGLFKLHLDHYLFVNTDFNLRRMHNGALQSINVKQSRRVISGEIHYLDHPKLGIILQIRRYQPPEVAQP